ncbi:MAG: glycerate kinase [Thermoguttaceae bacterium]|jgi:glycerate kinase
MKFLFASDSFKGSLTSEETSALLARAARVVFPGVKCESVVVADGGEGTAGAIVAATRGVFQEVDSCDPLMTPILARYGVCPDGRVVIEAAANSGLTLLAPERRDPLETTTFGTGELIRDALERGRREIALAIGGTATNDGGMGCARALGARFLDAQGRELQGRGRDLERVAHIDLSELDRRLDDARLTVMSDVTNPLCGEKGASPEVVERLERGMINYRDVIRRVFRVDPDAIPGAGAAGGLGTCASVFLGAKMQSGIDAVLDWIDFDARLRNVDLVVTGEGQTDRQSRYGKVVQGVARRAQRAGVPVIALSGALGSGAETLFDDGLDALATTVDAPMSLETAMQRAEELYYFGAERMFRLVRVGMTLARKS